MPVTSLTQYAPPSTEFERRLAQGSRPLPTTALNQDTTILTFPSLVTPTRPDRFTKQLNPSYPRVPSDWALASTSTSERPEVTATKIKVPSRGLVRRWTGLPRPVASSSSAPASSNLEETSASSETRTPALATRWKWVGLAVWSPSLTVDVLGLYSILLLPSRPVESSTRFVDCDKGHHAGASGGKVHFDVREASSLSNRRFSLSLLLE